MKIVVIEPHPDDAFLSLGWHLEEVWKEHEKLIITVYANEARNKEAETYARTIGAEHIGLKLVESDMNSVSTIRAVPELVKQLKEIRLTTDSLVIFPLGLQHPDHLRVAATRTAGCLRYVDTPYQTKLKLGDDLATKAEGKTLYSIRFPGKRKWRHKDIFKSQSKFFHYNEELLSSRLPEIVLE